MTLKNVVLPAPLGPMRLTIEPARDLEVDLVDGHEAAEALGDLACASRIEVAARRGGGRQPLRRHSVAEPRSVGGGHGRVTSASVAAAVELALPRRLLGNRPSGRSSIIPTRARP